jgi:hypothetical protein
VRALACCPGSNRASAVPVVLLPPGRCAGSGVGSCLLPAAWFQCEGLSPPDRISVRAPAAPPATCQVLLRCCPPRFPGRFVRVLPDQPASPVHRPRVTAPGSMSCEVSILRSLVAVSTKADSPTQPRVAGLAHLSLRALRVSVPPLAALAVPPKKEARRPLQAALAAFPWGRPRQTQRNYRT